MRRPSCRSLPSTSAGATSSSASVTTSPSRLTPPCTILRRPSLFDVHRRREREGHEGGDPDAAVPHVVGRDLHVGDVVGYLVGDEDAVELAFGRRARTVAVVQVDHRAGEQPLRVDGFSAPVASSRFTSLARASGQPVARSKYCGISSSGSDISLPNCSVRRFGDARRSSRATSTSSARRRDRRAAAW